MQEGMAKENIRALRGGFGQFNGEDVIVRKILWPPRSPVIFICGENSEVLCVSQGST
jgi:hypothetical protein